MSDQYMKELLRVAVAQICQTIGYNATQSAPLELLQDVLDKFMREFTRDLRRQVEHYNRTEPNLNDVTLTLSSINVNLNELLDYINNVEPVPFALDVPKFPARKDSSLNFLKPGSKEVLTRPVHVHAHLPPMLPPEITQPVEPPVLAGSSNGSSGSTTNLTDTKDNLTASTSSANGEPTNETSQKPLNSSTVLDKSTLQSLFKPSTNFEDGERPTREVSSVVMTTGGYISPAVEGKMPEAIVPDIIDKLLGLDAPPPPPPPPAPPTQSRPASRSANSTPNPLNNDNLSTLAEKDAPERDMLPTTSKESKKQALARSLEPQPVTHKKTELLADLSNMKKHHKLFHPSGSKNFPPDLQPQPVGNFNKKSFMMHQNNPGALQTPQTNYANMLLKKAKKQKVPLMPGQPLNEKHSKPMADKIGKMDAADKAHRKYMKMLQKMAKQGKIPPELMSNIMGPDKKSKQINPAIVASMPPGPERVQLEKLLRKQAKQRQKMLKQQILMEMQKQTKKPQQQPPPLVPLFPPRMPGDLNKPLALEMEEQKLKMDSKDLANVSPVKPQFTPNLMANTTPSVGHQLTETLLNKSHKTTLDTPPVELMDSTGKPLLTADGKELKLSNEPDRSKLNIFKKISKQKTPKSSSPTPMRLTGLNDTPLINLPSGTTITPAPGPSNPPNSSTPHSATPLSRNLFPPLNDNNANSNNIINVDDIKEKPVAPTALPPAGQINPPQATDLSLLNRVFGEKPPDVELINKPKKRGRKPGSKNSPKIPGQFPANMLKKASKKMKLDNSHLFPGQMPPQLPPDFGAGGGMGNLSFDSMTQLFANPLNPMEWAQNKHLQQQMMIMAGAKERKEHKKKSKLLKQDLLNNDNNMATLNMTNPSSSMGVPTNEEVQSINKKLMRMDTILKAAPSSSSSTTDLSVDTSLITGKKLPSPAMFPSAGSSASSTSPLKSPGNSKRLMSGAEAMASSLVQPFMLPNRPAFPNLPSNMLSMLQFPFPPRPGLIPPPGLFPTPGLGAFPNNPKNPLLPGLFPFPNLKQPMADSAALNQDTEDLTTDKKKSDTNLAAERSYCNVAPLVPDYLTKLNEQQKQHSGSGNKHSHDSSSHEPDLPKTPKPRNSHSNTLTHDNLLKKMQDAHTPESAGGSISGKSIPSTPGGMSLNTFEQLMKKNESPVDLMALNKHTKSLSQSQESGLDFSMNKKSGHVGGGVGMSSAGGGLSIKTPITLNNEPIEVSDDSDETNQPPAKSQSTAPTHLPSQPSQVFPGSTHHSSFNMDDMFVANTSNSGSHMPTKSLDSDLSTKELKKLKKQVKKSSSSISSTSLMGADKTEGLAGAGGQASAGGVGKLAGGADLIPLTSTGIAYSSKNIPYNSLTANANPSFNAHKTDFTNSAGSSSGGTAPSSSSVFDNLTITAAIPSSSGASSSTVYDLQKKRKEHKKLKKLKELKDGKIKKKKDKKDKNKSKEKAEKYLQTHTQSSPVKEKEQQQQQQPTIEIIPTAVAPPPVMGHHNPSTTASSSVSSSNPEKIKDKDLLKKLKKEKKKEKLRTNLDDHHQQHHTTQNSSSLQQSTSISNSSTGSNKDLTTAASSSSATGPLSLDIEPTKKQKLSPALLHSSSSGNEHNNETPSGGSATTTATAPAAIVPKLTLKLGSTHSPTPPRDDSHKNTTTTSSSLSSAATVQPPAAVSSPPREHQREPSPELARISPLVTRPPKHKLNTSGELSASSTAPNSISAANASSLDIGDGGKTSSSSNPNMVVPPPSPWLSGGTISASSVLLPHQLLQTTKQHDITSTTAGGAAHHNTDAASKTASADRQSPLTLITETSRPSSYIDAEGNRVWICPACGKVDDGSPMIGCDGCDAWYHWVCVGIFVAPKDNEDWFCRVCITRKKGLHGSDKKRKRNKKK